MRILITNNTLDARAGSEVYVRDMALALLRRGHNPVAYSTRLGAVADELRAATIPVIDDLESLAVAPDIIHGQHHLDAMTAMLHFPDTPAIYFCHGWTPWEEMAPAFPTIRRYVAVDDLCLERLQCLHGISPERISVIRNFVDLERFPLRGELPAIARRALVFSNYISEHGCLPILRQACDELGIVLDSIGLCVGRGEAQPERLLGDYDIVFGKARCALEALATGTAVIACDAAGLGGMVTPDNYDMLRRLNFGIRSLRMPITVETVAEELRRYNAGQAREVALRARSEVGIDDAVDRLLEVYRQAIADHVDLPRSREPHLKAASSYLRQIAAFTKGRYAADQARDQARLEAAAQHSQLQRAEFALAQERAQRAAAEHALAQCDLRMREISAANEHAQSESTARHELAMAAQVEQAGRALAAQEELRIEAELVLAQRDSELTAIRHSSLWPWVNRLYRMKEKLWNKPMQAWRKRRASRPQG